MPINELIALAVIIAVVAVFVSAWRKAGKKNREQLDYLHSLGIYPSPLDALFPSRKKNREQP